MSATTGSLKVQLFADVGSVESMQGAVRAGWARGFTTTNPTLMQRAGRELCGVRAARLLSRPHYTIESGGTRVMTQIGSRVSWDARGSIPPPRL